MRSTSRLVLGTHNSGKVDELRSLLSDLPFELVPARVLEAPPDVEEDKNTLQGNARKKAKRFYQHTGFPSLADDTGLEVTALDGAPGVRTARFAGPEATPEDNKRRLLEVLDGVQDRRARFRTVIALVDEEETVRTFEGTCEGTITEKPRGQGGFGYDPLFLPDGHRKTFAEMSADAKNEISHRREALNALREHLATVM